MREIKFRGKREDNGEWVFGSFIPDALEGSNSDLVSWGFIRRYNRGIGKMETIEVDRETVGQYTGLLDRHGVEICEGDIVGIQREKERDDIEEYQISTVYFNADYASFLAKPQRDWVYTSWDEVEVIGNIHDNPELLKG